MILPRVMMLVIAGALGGCAGDWPPQCGDEPMGEAFPSPRGTGDDWTFVYRSREDAEANRDSVGTAILMNEREYEVPYNLFEAEPAKDLYVESQFEVLYADRDRTQIRATKEAGDGIAQLMGRFNPNMGRDVQTLLVVPGTRIRCGEAVYEIRREGWFLDGELKRKF